MDQQHYEYRTGGAAPKKNRSGPIAFLLILLIFLGGIVSALGLLNIRLTLQSAKSDPNRPLLTFTQTDPTGTATASLPVSADRSVTLSGMICRELSPQYQQMYSLPEGLYIAKVVKNSPSARLGILPGDVLTGFNGIDVFQLDALESLINGQPNGAQVEIVIYRGGQFLRMPLTLKH